MIETETYEAEVIDKTKIPLKRVLGLTTAILLVAGNMIGTGVFKKIVPMAQTGLDSKWILSAWITAGLITILGAFTIAGLAKMTTASGGMYEYFRLCFGNLISFLFGWTYFIIIGSGSVAAVGFIFAQSVNSLVTLHDPLNNFRNISIGNFIYPFANSGIKIFAIATIAVLTWFNSRGIKKGTTLNNVVTGAKILGILLLIFLGLFFSGSHIDNIVVQPITNNPASVSMFSIFFGAILSAFWAYSGFANVGYVTGEIKNPRRNVPIAIITGVIMVMILYVLVNYAYMKTLSLQQLATIGQNNIAATSMAGSIMGKPGIILVSLLIMLSAFGALNVMIIFYSRLYYRMAQENVFFKNAAKVHPVYRTPYMALFYSIAWSIVLVISGTFDILTDMVVFASFLFFAFIAMGLIKMKIKKRIIEKIPGYPWAPVIFILFMLILSINTFIAQPKLATTGLVLILSGLPFYYFFKRQNKKER